MEKKKQSEQSTKKISKVKKIRTIPEKVVTLKTEEKKQSVFRLSDVLGLVLITIIVSFLMAGATVYSLMKHSSLTEDKYTEEILKQYHYITDNYYDAVDKKKISDGAIKGMLEALDDDYSSFIDENNNSLFDKTLEGSYEGIGIEVYNDGENIVVLRCFEGSPAYEAGIRPGDNILFFNEIDLRGKETSVLSDYISKYSSRKEFTLTYEREGVKKEVNVKKKYVVIPSVTSKTYEKNEKKIGYVVISQFSATTYNQFKKVLEELEKEPIDSLIIDLRDNTGGHLSVVSDMLSLLMDKSHVIYQIKTKTKTEKFYSKGKTTKTYPIVILQNGSSASASELMSSALKEQMNAAIVGTTSYGKGTVQELVDLKNGNEYKFTTKKWLTSKGVWINKKGVTPTIEVKLDDKYFETALESDDNQFQRALEEASK